MKQGFNVIGHISGNFGLAVAARNTVAMLLERGDEVAVVDVEAGAGRSRAVMDFAHLESAGEKNPFSVNVFHMNPPDVAFLMADRHRQFELDQRLNVCVPFWELTRLPLRTWKPVLESCDFVLAPTRFVASAVETSADSARVLHYPQTAFVPDGITGDKGRWGIPATAVTYLVALDLGSDVSRKNPWATIEAFQQAFGDDPSAHLVVKLNNAASFRDFSEHAERIRTIAADARNITLVDAFLPYRDLLELYASCDVMCSLHRSEGLGLHLLEAMALSRPVVATRWGGNMDFMDDADSMLVDYELVPVESTHPEYAPENVGPDQRWAEPRVDDAVAKMRALHDDPELRARIGAGARAAYERTRRQYTQSPVMDELLAHAERLDELADHPQRARQLREQRRIGTRKLLRRRTGQILRRMGLRK